MVDPKVMQAVEMLKNWHEEAINTINGAAESGVETIKLQGGSGTVEITGRDKDMFLAGLKAAGGMFGKFPFLLDTPDGELEISTDSKRLQFLIENRYRVERWNIFPNKEKFFVYNSEDDVLAEAFTAREAIDEAMEEYLEA